MIRRNTKFNHSYSPHIWESVFHFFRLILSQQFNPIENGKHIFRSLYTICFRSSRTTKFNPTLSSRRITQVYFRNRWKARSENAGDFRYAWLNTKFNWQSGFGEFSYSKSQIDRVVKYILNQEEHHKKMTFKNEYLSLLKKFEVEYEERYLFEWID